MGFLLSSIVSVLVLISAGTTLIGQEKGMEEQIQFLGRKAALPGAQAETTLEAAAVAVAEDPVLWPSTTINDSLKDLIQRLPKAELHIHIEGTLEAEMMMKFGARNNVTLPYADVAEAKAAREHFQNLQSFLDAYQTGLTVLITEEDFYELTAAYLETAAANNITHTEIFFDVQSHVKRGIPISAIITGLQRAITERATHPTAPVSASLILCLVRELGEAAAAATLALSLPYLTDIRGLGLASTEVGYPPELYKHVYAAAGALGLHKVAHAGEESGPDYVWGAIRSLGAQRIDHGIHSLEDPSLVDYMSTHGIPITLCPISNKKLQVYGAQLPEKLCQMLTSGIPVTINSDDPAYFGAYVNGNYEFIAGLAGLGADDIAALAQNSFNASFLPEEQKAAAFRQVQHVLAAWKAEQPAAQQQEQQQL